MDAFIELFDNYTFRTVLLGSVGIGAVSGAFGCFSYLRRQSLVGDVVSHSSLLGIMLVFLASYWLTGQGSKSLYLLLPGALMAGVAALLLTRWIVDRTPVREDSGLGTMLAIFFGGGILLLRAVQSSRRVIPGRGGLQDFLFGMAASMTRDDLIMIAVIGSLSLVTLLLYWRQLKVVTFDPLFAHSVGFNTGFLNVLLIMLMVNSIVIGIQCVGVILMIALLVSPAAAARQWTNSLGGMVGLSACFGGFAGATGSIVSALIAKMPTGPVIVLAGVAIFVFSILFAPRRGVIVTKWNRQRVRMTASFSGDGADQ
ncbi:MAG: metal ABC transporter permease [Planctomycetota bacterium]